MSSKVVNFSTDLSGNGKSKSLSKFCANVAKEFPLIKKSWCIAAGKHLQSQGKKVTAKSVLKAAKEFASDNASFALPMSKTTNMQPRSFTGKGRQSGTTFVGENYPIGGSTTYAPVSASHNVSRRSKPKMSIRGDAVIVRHSEMVGAVLSGSPTSNVTAYRAVGYRANPGISTIFAWLSSFAVNYEKYRFRSLKITLVPLVATSFSGRIGVGFDFDSSDAVPGNRQEFYALTTHSESMPWQACAINVNCDNIYRFTGTHVAADNKLIDLGQVIIMSDAISGGTISAAIPVFDLIVDYEVELIEAQQSLFSTQAFSNSSVLTAGVPLGTGVDQTVINGPTVVSSTTVAAGVITVVLPAGNYVFSTRMNWTTGTATYNVATTTTSATLKVDTFAGASFAASIGSITCASDMTMTFTVTTVTYTANMNSFNMMFSRASSAVASNYLA